MVLKNLKRAIQLVTTASLAVTLNIYAQTDIQEMDDTAQKVNQLATELVSARLHQAPEFGIFFQIPNTDFSRITDNSPEALAALWQKEDQITRALATVAPDKLTNRSDLVTYQILKETLTANRNARICQRQLWNLNHMFGWQALFNILAPALPTATEQQRENLLKRWSQIPDFIANEKNNLSKGLSSGYSTPRIVAQRVLNQVRNLSELPADQTPFFTPARKLSDQPEYQQRLLDLIDSKLKPALSDFGDFLEQHYIPNARTTLGIKALPNGEACYDALLRVQTSLPVTGKTTFEHGQQVVAENYQAILELGKELYNTEDFASTIKATLTDKNNRFSSEEQVITFSQNVVDKAMQQMHHYFEPVPEQIAVVKPYPAYERGSGQPSRYEAGSNERPGIYRINLDHWEDETRGGAEITAFHEAWPGHHLQVMSAGSVESSHPISKLVSINSFTEGWARYTEMFAEEANLYSEPAALITRRAWPARGMVVDPGIHLFDWTEQQAIEYLVESGRFGESDAKDMIARIANNPAQLTSYDTGGLFIKELRRRAKEQLGERFDIKAFHRAVLENGAIPMKALETNVNNWITDTLK